VGCGSNGVDALDGGSRSRIDASVDAASSEASSPEPSYCTTQSALSTVTDLSGTWVVRVVGSQIVTAPFVGALYPKSIFYILTTLRQSGTAVTAEGHYCDRTEIDPPGTLVPVVIPEKWAHTEKPVSRAGTFASVDGGVPVLTFPKLFEVAGAVLPPNTTDLPTDATDPRVIDEDGDGYPGITINLSGQSFAGSLYSVQSQTTSVTAIAVAPDRVEGQLIFASAQNVLYSDPSNLAALYAQSKTSPDYVPCNSTFSMVKIAEATSSDGGVDDGGLSDSSDDAGSGVTCAWVRANESTLFPQ
jgi:hypothetical protein